MTTDDVAGGGGKPQVAVSVGSVEAEKARLRAEQTVRRLMAAKAVVAMVLVLCAFIVLSMPWSALFAPAMRAGEVWQGQDVMSPVGTFGIDIGLIDNGRKFVEDNNDKVFVLSPDSLQQSLVALRTVDSAFASLGTELDGRDLSRSIRTKTGVGLLPATCDVLENETSRSEVVRVVGEMLAALCAKGMMTDITMLRAAGQAERARLEYASADLVSTMTVAGVLGYPTEAFGYMANVWMREHCAAGELADASADLGRQILHPNITFSPARTEARKQELLDALNPSYPIPAGSVILKRGDLTTPQQEALARVVGEMKTRKLALKILGNAAMSALILLVVFWFTRMYRERRLPFTWRNVLLLCTPILVAIVTPELLIAGGVPRTFGETYCYPAGFIGMVFALLFQGRLGILMMMFGCASYGIMRGMDFSFLPVALGGNIVALLWLRGAVLRKDLFKAGVAVSVVTLMVAVILSWVNGMIFPPREVVALALANGMFCYAMTSAMLPIFEMMYRVTTPWRLWEITSLDHPLLRIMEQKIPGSYQHVLDVAKFAEGAAQAVGADRLLVRAGAYFHDVGKITRPMYFTENQVTPEQREAHKSLSPSMSANVIKQHVFDGIKLAKEHNLPQEVADFIPQHHGTSLIGAFYAKAKKDSADNMPIPELEFRYPGPRPQSIEAAIVMIADTLEAASTSKFKKREQIQEYEIVQLVDQLIAAKIADHQLDACPITREQLELIRREFVRAIQARYHGRVAYPDPERTINPKDATTKAVRSEE